MLFLELTRRQEDLRRIDELQSYDTGRRNMMSMHRPDAYNTSVANLYHQNQPSAPAAASAAYQYNDFQQNAYPNPTPLIPQSSQIDAAYTTNQIARGYNVPAGSNTRPSAVDYNHQHQGFDRKRPRY